MRQQRYQPANTLGYLLGGIGRGVVRLVFLFCIGLSLLSGTFWYRSPHTFDVVESATPDHAWMIVSGVDRLVIRSLSQPWGSQDDFVPFDWNYRNMPAATGEDPWQDSGWKLIGIDWGQLTPVPQMPFEGTWVRIKWSTLMVLFAVPPLAWTIWRRVRDRRREFLVAGYCPKCEFPLNACACEDGQDRANLSH
ncbi:MAG: hypothetical protein AAGD32_01030 [Planctomycetota bacterium]